MEQEVYVDLYFLINTCMNLLTLMITASLLHRKVSRWRAWLAAAAGGLWAVAALFWGVMGIWGLLMDGAIIFLMCAIHALVCRTDKDEIKEQEKLLDSKTEEDQ